MMALGQRITLEEASNMIAQFDQNGDRALDEVEFVSLMLPKMKEELLS
jgi:Ca2+-binding EF-hand superfamily protein